ncbi:Peptide methionine sulfoxide reductase MsrA / Thiol:disulfide oxidoreductase associated with MetSO reductase / Peptide methionine sulfoxide reductase MsrB [hydrothermal vent metagenome]|uniref:peptide-methionine (S)-S-oxide reductase n=1 Tax=hydrothermal vent metagenome TaxID=652676 RepID=A0A3B1E1W3_9ZZZZ
MIAEIVFAAGCFWGVEKHFECTDGVIDVKSGYTGGNYKNPTYKDVLRYRNLDKNSKIINHTEAVKVKFDTTKIDVKKLIIAFWELHDPTQLNRQGNDVGTNYRSAIFYTNDNQKNISFQTKEQYQKLLTKKGYGKIVTSISKLNIFWDAEQYHQDYLAKNPNGYCPNHSTGVKFIQTNSVNQNKTITPLGGKEMIVIKSEFFCPYCERFEKEISSVYKGLIPLRTVLAKDLKDFDIKTKLDATPTILFIEDGKEIIVHRGFINSKEFYKTLGDFKLGKNSESYNVAFNQGTDGRYCKQYDIFKNTPDGVFIDKLSGDVLFDTKDRFNSKSGWLSFYKAIDGATIQKADNSYGMKRIEVIAKKSGIHLGHVFPRSDGKQRFCINATVLEFVKR